MLVVDRTSDRSLFADMAWCLRSSGELCLSLSVFTTRRNQVNSKPDILLK